MQNDLVTREFDFIPFAWKPEIKRVCSDFRFANNLLVGDCWARQCSICWSSDRANERGINNDRDQSGGLDKSDVPFTEEISWEGGWVLGRIDREQINVLGVLESLKSWVESRPLFAACARRSLACSIQDQASAVTNWRQPCEGFGSLLGRGWDGVDTSIARLERQALLVVHPKIPNE